MHSYAQTNLQLFNQLRRDGYSNADLGYILKAYDLAACLLTARFQHSGKPTIAHFVGTASILSSLHVSAKVVAAGLLHNVYEIGDFGDGRKGISGPKREQVKRAVGSEVEEYAARYTAMRWNKRTIPTICKGLAGLDAIDRDVVLIHLADHLEHHLDDGVLYFDDVKRQRFMDCNDHVNRMVEMAEQLGFPTLATELARVIRGIAGAEIPIELRNPSYWGRGQLIPPKSYRLRLSFLLNQKLAGLRRWCRTVLRFRKTLATR